MKDNKNIEEKLKEFGKEFKLDERVVKKGTKNVLDSIDEPKKSVVRFFPAMIAAAMLIVSLMATTVLAFPEVAKKYATGLPIVKELEEKENKVEETQKEVQSIAHDLDEKIKETEAKEKKVKELQEEIEELEIKIKEIANEKIKEVQTTENEDEEMNLKLQTVVVEFTKLMYQGKYEEAAEYCTNDFKDFVINNPEDIILRGEDSAVFTQITNIAKTESGIYLVFLRLNDSRDEANHQLNFEITEENGEFKISFVGLDA